jgi:hypothetical protein
MANKHFTEHQRAALKVLREIDHLTNLSELVPEFPDFSDFGEAESTKTDYSQIVVVSYRNPELTRGWSVTLPMFKIDGFWRLGGDVEIWLTNCPKINDLRGPIRIRTSCGVMISIEARNAPVRFVRAH